MRADVVGFNDEGKIIILECKASLEDFKKDCKWEQYLPYCNEFYFVFADTIDIPEIDVRCGVLRAYKKYLDIYHESRYQDIENPQSLIYLIARNLSKRVTFGY